MSDQTEPEGEGREKRPDDYDQQVYDQQKAEKEAANDERQERLGRTRPSEEE